MTTYDRGSVVLVRFPHSDLATYSKRPALVVQDERVETGLRQRIVVLIASNLNRRGETRVLVRKESREGRAMGLLTDSAVVADNIVTVLPRELDKVIGKCTIMPKVDEALRRALGL